MKVKKSFIQHKMKMHNLTKLNYIQVCVCVCACLEEQKQNGVYGSYYHTA